MATITFTIAAAPYTRAVTAICTYEGYQVTIDGAPNPQTPQEFFKQWIIKKIKERVKEYESNTAAATAASNAGADVDANIVIT